MALNKRPIHGVPEANAIIHINHTITMPKKAIKIHFSKIFLPPCLRLTKVEMPTYNLLEIEKKWLVHGESATAKISNY